MIRTLSRVTAAFAVAFLVAALPAMAGEPDAKDVSSLFTTSGLAVDQLHAIDVDGILILRGRTDDQSTAAEAGRFAQSLGYVRVANLIQINERVDDAAIARRAERALAINRALNGCRLTVASINGEVVINGEVQHEIQRDVAVQLVRNLDGVRTVRADLRRF